MLHANHQDIHVGELIRPIKALLLDDSAFDRTRIRRMTEKSALQIEFEEVPSIEAMTNRMDHNVFDLIMIDFQLPEGDGLQALNLIQNHPTNRNATKIMITGQEQADIAISAFRQGCHDFITKDELSVAMLKRAMQSSMQQTDDDRYRAGLLTAKFQQQIQLLLLGAIDSDLIQSALSRGVKKAAEDIGLDVGNLDKTSIIMKDFLDDDIVGFDFTVPT